MCVYTHTHTHIHIYIQSSAAHQKIHFLLIWQKNKHNSDSFTPDSYCCIACGQFLLDSLRERRSGSLTNGQVLHVLKLLAAHRPKVPSIRKCRGIQWHYCAAFSPRGLIQLQRETAVVHPTVTTGLPSSCWGAAARSPRPSDGLTRWCKATRGQPHESPSHCT